MDLKAATNPPLGIGFSKLGKTFNFQDLASADLVVDAVYEGGRKGNSSDEPINKLVRGGNQGGFRYVGSPLKGETKLVILYSTMDDPDWPDSLDQETGTFHFYGDNKKPGHELHDTGRRGNALLKSMFDQIHPLVRECRKATFAERLIWIEAI